MGWKQAVRVYLVYPLKIHIYSLLLPDIIAADQHPWFAFVPYILEVIRLRFWLLTGHTEYGGLFINWNVHIMVRRAHRHGLVLGFLAIPKVLKKSV